MKELKVKVKSKSGIHARPAGLIVELAQNFKSEVMIQKGEHKINGKSIMAVLSMAAQNGENLKILADGSDELEVINAFDELFNARLVHE